MSEFDAIALMRLTGMPQSCHLMFSSGERAGLGLASPSLRRLQVGDPTFLAYGIWGALNARGGWLARDQSDLPAEVRDYVGQAGGALLPRYSSLGTQPLASASPAASYMKSSRRSSAIHFTASASTRGIWIHLDEWLHSPIYAHSEIPLRSGMAIQVDVIPATHSPYHTTNIEDGIALADEALRRAFWQKYPAAWNRIQQRRAYMRNTLGIKLKPEVLPFSNMPAYLPPYWLAPQCAMRALD